MNPISILIPTRNRSAILAKCLAALSLGVRGFDPPEVIVVDDCSADQTQEVVRAFRSGSGWQVRFLRHSTPLGANAARNAALRIARGEIIVLIDDDAIATEGWLVKLLRALSPERPVVTGAIRLTLKGPILGRHRDEVSTYLSEVLAAPRGISGETVPVACNMAAYRWVFNRAVFDESVKPPVEECDWLHRAGVTATFVSEALVWHYKTEEEVRLSRMLSLAWLRGSEGGWWIRERLKMPFRFRLSLAVRSLHTSVRGFGHVGQSRCWGGATIGLSELAKALALLGVINRGCRVTES